MTLMELFNLAVLIAFIYFSAWAFYLKFKANRVTTTRDLLHAFITGGILAVTTMVFGVTDEIIDATTSIKQDTVNIQSILVEGDGVGSDQPLNLLTKKDLAELYRLTAMNADTLQGLVATTNEINKKLDDVNRTLLTASGGENSDALQGLVSTTDEINKKLDGANKTLRTVLNLTCLFSDGQGASLIKDCAIRPNER